MTRRATWLAVLSLLATLTVLGVGAPPTAAEAPPLAPGCTGSDVGAQRFNSQAISASGTPTITSTLNVAFNVAVGDVDVITNLAHTFPGDIDMSLTSPAGTTVTLTTDNGMSNDNIFDGTRWDDQANPGGQVLYTTNNGLVTDHAYANNVPVATLAPEEPLAAFVGEMSGGTWTLTIHDDANQDGGSLDGWSLDFGGNGTVQPNAVLGANTTNRTIPAGLASLVTSDIQISGAPTHLTDLSLLTALEHGNNGDLDITLRSPAGTVATVTSDNGGSFNDVFDGVIWGNGADPDGVVPYAVNQDMVTDRQYANEQQGSPLTPEESFAVFAGENPNGTWRLSISDDTDGNGGRLDDWALVIHGGHCGDVVPDAILQRGQTAPVGDDVYNTTGVDQSRTATIARGATATFRITGQNDSTHPDRLRFRGGRSMGPFTIRYLAPNGTNITNAVVNQGWVSPTLAPEASVQIRAQVTLAANAGANATLTRSGTVSSTVDPQSSDVVKFTTKRG